MFKIYDGREHFYQWDLDRRLIIEDASVKQVHFCNRTGDCALVCETFVEDNLILVNVPNILLQTDWKIHVYAYDGYHTKHSICYDVKSRSKPADYLYEETEILNYRKLEEKIEDVEEELESKTNALEKEIENNTNSLIAFGEKIDGFESGIESNAKSLGELESKTSALEKEIESKTNSLESKTTTLENKTNNLESKTNSLESKTTNLENKTSALEKTVESNTNALSAFGATVISLEEGIERNTTALGVLESNVNALAEDLETNNISLTELAMSLESKQDIVNSIVVCRENSGNASITPNGKDMYYSVEFKDEEALGAAYLTLDLFSLPFGVNSDHNFYIYIKLGNANTTQPLSLVIETNDIAITWIEEPTIEYPHTQLLLAFKSTNGARTLIGNQCYSLEVK